MAQQLETLAHHIETTGARNTLSHVVAELTDEQRGQLAQLGLGTEQLLVLLTEKMDVPGEANKIAGIVIAAIDENADATEAVIRVERETLPFATQLRALLKEVLRPAA